MEDKKKDIIDTVQVALRIRPLVESEIARGCEECIQVVPGEPQVQVKDLAFTYNHVFPPHIGQQEFYDRAVKQLVNMLFQGYNVTILAYGQTGSGKTYSMGTNYSGSEGDNNNLGIIPQAVADIFDYTDLHDNEFKFKIWVSFMELYQEQCYDLLSQKSRNHSVVEIREDHRGVILPGLTEQEVANSAETMTCLMRGSEGRAVGATAMNSMSSRSHAVFTIHISKESKQDKNQATMSKFHLVDLAGSERTKKTKATGNRLKEGIKINQGLLALGNVISALGDGTNKGYICYRESKLTRLLQDSLGGNSLTLMLACVSPADYNLEETVSTLRYADRARQIRNKPIINQDAKAAEIVRLHNLVSELRLQLVGQGGGMPSDSLPLMKQLEQERTKYSELLQKHKLLTNMLHTTLAENTNLCEKALLADNAKENFERKLNELAEKWNQTIATMNSTLDSCDDKSVNKENIMDYFKDMKTNLEDLQSVQVKCNEQIMEHDIRSVSTQRKEDDVGEENGEAHEMMEKEGSDEATSIFHREALAMDQVALNKELQELNQAMALKMSVVNQITSNTKELITYNENLKENEAKIVNLEKEKSELLQQLKHVHTKTRSDPSVDERRNKVQLLENEIQDLKKKCQQQANLIKMKEKNEAKIQSLNKEIQNMKAAKVSLVKRMRAESEKFRKWKLENDRNLCRMKAEDRKKQTAIARMASMHTKQQNVMKRKMEEAVAINKRLKDALDKQKIAQAKRGKPNNNKGDHIQQWLEQELEVLLSTLDAERTLEELMEDRSLLTAQLDELRTDVENSEENRDKIEQLTEELMLRKAQISDLQQKILSADQENKARTMWDHLHTMQETKTALKHLFEILIESKRGQQRRAARHACLEGKHEQLQEAYDELNELYETSKKKYVTQLSVLDMQQEEKISQLIQLGRGVNFVGDGSAALQHLQQRLNLQDEELDRLLAEKVKLAAEVEMLKNQLADLRNHTPDNRAPVPRKKKTPALTVLNHTFQDSDTTDDSDDNEERDPNWRATPLHKRAQVQRSRLTMNFTALEPPRMGDVNGTTSSDILDVPSANVTVRNGSVKRSSDGQPRCSCRGSCASKHCSCKKANEVCGSSCKCQKVLCKNQTLPSDSSLENNKENKANHTISIKQSDEDSFANSINQSEWAKPHSKKKRYFFYPPEEPIDSNNE